MKIRIEISKDQPEEVVIHAHEWNDEVQKIQTALQTIEHGNELDLTFEDGSTVYFVPLDEILFFETDGEVVKVHTKDKIYTSHEKLCQLEQHLPRTFARVSKSCILNSAKVISLCRGVTGTAEAQFADTVKRAYISRMYFKAFQNLIYETRISL